MTSLKTTIFVAANNIVLNSNHNENMFVSVCSNEESARNAMLSNVIERFSCSEELHNYLSHKDIENAISKTLNITPFTRNIPQYPLLNNHDRVKSLLDALLVSGAEKYIAARDAVFKLIWNLEQTTGTCEIESFDIDIKSLDQQLFVAVDNIYCVENEDECEQSDEIPLTITVSYSEEEARHTALRSVLAYHAESIAELIDYDNDIFLESDSEAISAAYKKIANDGQRTTGDFIYKAANEASDAAIVDMFNRFVLTDDFAGDHSIHEFALGFTNQNK